MIAVSLMVNLNETAIQDHATLGEWVDILNRSDDAFTDRRYELEITWDDIYTAIATDAFAGGSYGRFVLSIGVAIEREDDDRPRADTENGPGLDDRSDGMRPMWAGVDPADRPAR